MQVAIAAALTVAQIVISRLLAGKRPDAGPRQTETQRLVVDSVAPRQKIYGHHITAGSLVAARSHPADKRDHFTFVSVLADHTSEGMTHVWIDTDRLTIGTDLEANGKIYDSGTAQGGTQRVEEPYDPENNQFGNQPGYITLRAGASATDNEYAGMTVEITGGTGSGQSETIESYDGSLKRAYIAGFWGTVPDGTSTYEVKVEVAGWEDWLIPVKGTAKGNKYIRNGEPLIGFKIYLGDQTTADTRLKGIEPGTLEHSGTATGGGSNFIDLDAGASASDDFYNGMILEITGGTGVGQGMRVRDYDGTLKRAFRAGTWTTEPVSGSTFEIRSGVWWGADRVGENVTYLGCTWKTDAELGFGARMPEIRIEGDYANDIYDWRTSTTGYTNNAVLCMADWLLWEHGPFQRLNASWVKVGLDETNFVSSEMISEANIADEAVTLKDGVTTQPRYTVNGIVSSDDNPEDVFRKFFLALGGGMLARRASQMFVRAGSDRSSVMTLTEKDIAYSPSQGIVTRTRHSARERFNTVEGEYHDSRPKQGFERTNYPAVTQSGYLSADNSRRTLATINFDYCTDHERAQRLALIQLHRHRGEMTVTAPFLFTGGNPPGPWRLEVGDVVTLERSVYTGGSQEFWVQSMRGLGDDLTELTLREYFDFWLEDPDAAEDVEEADFADLWDGRIDDLTGLAATTVVDSEGVRPNGQLTVQMTLSCNTHPNSIVRRQGSYRFRWRHISQTAWRGAVSEEPAVVAPNLVVDQRYEVQALAEVNTGSLSAKSRWAPNPPLQFDASTSEFPLPGPPGTGSTGENRFPNPIYAHGLNGWVTALLNGSITIEDEGKFGANAARVQYDGPGLSLVFNAKELIKCEFGERIRYRLWIKWKTSFTSGASVDLRLIYADRDGAVLSDNLLTTLSEGTDPDLDIDDDVWKVIGGVHTVPQDAAVYVRPYADLNDMSVGDAFYLDGWMARQILTVSTTVVTSTAAVNGLDDGSGTVWNDVRSVVVGKPGDTVHLTAICQARVAATSSVSQIALRLRLIRYDSDGVSNPLVLEGPHADYMVVEPGSLYANYKPEGASSVLGYETPFLQVSISGADTTGDRGEFTYKCQFTTSQPNGRAQVRHRKISFALE